MTELPTTVVDTDHRLETAEHKASEALAKHRWHWTLDESNPDRVSMNAYALAVGRNYRAVYIQARGYANWISYEPRVITLGEAVERAGQSAEKIAVVEAVATARGTSFKTASTRSDEVGRVRELARERAEKNETSVAEEAPRIAESIVRSERAEAEREQRSKQRHSLRFIEIDADLRKMLRLASNVLNDSHGVPFSDEERGLLAETIGKIRALLNLIDLRFDGAADVDWDAELEKIVGV